MIRPNLLLILLLVHLGHFGSWAQANFSELVLDKSVALGNLENKDGIDNHFDIYNRITSRSTIVKTDTLAYSNKSFSEPKDYYNYHFVSPVDFNRVEFQDVFDFSLSHCFKSVNWHQSVFYSEAFFTWSKFDDEVVFSRTTFKKNVDFIRIVFDQDADFFQSNFHGVADFYGTKFNKDLNFINSNFYAAAIYSFAIFNGDANFRNAEFSDNALFNNSELNSIVDFSGTQFDSIVDFSGSSINGDLIFDNVTLPSFLDLSNISTIKNTLDLTEVKPSEKYRICEINLLNTDISKIKMRYDNFILWFPENTSYDAKCNVYNALLTSFQNYGFQTSYEKLDIEFQEFKFIENDHKLRNHFQKIWWNYGYDKGAIFAWVLWIVSILTVINTLFINVLMGKIYEISFLNYEKIKARFKLHHPILSFCLNIPTGFLYTLILLIGGAFGMGFNSSQIKFPNFIGLIYIISIGLLGISCTAFMLNYIFEL